MKNKRSSTRISLEKGDFLPTLLLSPTLFIVLVVMIVPFFYGLYISLYAYKVGGRLDGETLLVWQIICACSRTKHLERSRGIRWNLRCSLPPAIFSSAH